MTAPPLVGFSALELTCTPAGAFCGRLLADLGFDVLKVEPPDGDPARRRGSFPGGFPDDEASGAFLFLNAGKRSLTLDLETATGGEIAARLAARVDVVVEELSPGVLALESVANLVVVSLTAFGRNGQRREWKAKPLTTCHAAGFVAGNPPAAPPGLGGELRCGLVAAVACLRALGRRETTGGERVDISKTEALASFAPHRSNPSKATYATVVHPVAGKLRIPSLFADAELRPAPLLGQHNAEVLGGLGFDAAETGLLVGTGIV